MPRRLWPFCVTALTALAGWAEPPTRPLFTVADLPETAATVGTKILDGLSRFADFRWTADSIFAIFSAIFWDAPITLGGRLLRLANEVYAFEAGEPLCGGLLILLGFAVAKRAGLLPLANGEGSADRWWVYWALGVWSCSTPLALSLFHPVFMPSGTLAGGIAALSLLGALFTLLYFGPPSLDESLDELLRDMALGGGALVGAGWWPAVSGPTEVALVLYLWGVSFGGLGLAVACLVGAALPGVPSAERAQLARWARRSLVTTFYLAVGSVLPLGYVWLVPLGAAFVLLLRKAGPRLPPNA